MLLSIDGKKIQANPNQSLRALIHELGLDGSQLRDAPLAAKIAGEVFTLNYIPVRLRDSELDTPVVRRAMAASNGEVKLLRYADASGKDVYVRSMLYVVFLAIRKLWPKAEAKVSCTLGNSMYITISGSECVDVLRLKAAIRELVEEDFSFWRIRMSREAAVAAFEKQNQPDKARLLAWRESKHFDAYLYKEYMDYFYGEMVPSSGYLTVWDLLPADGGFVLLYPDDSNPEVTSQPESMANFFAVFSEGERWCSLMECENVADLNDLTKSGKIRELIRVNEALHEKRFSQIADHVCSRGAKIVMLAGPSSSGKTTSANRLATQLRVHGKKPILMSLDDYYYDRDKIAPGPDGKLDLEHINTIDADLFREHMGALLNGEEIELPTFNFMTGRREWNGGKLKLDESSVIVAEGLHALNPVMLPEHAGENMVFRLYVSPMLPLNLDNHNRIPTSYLRLLRRIVRDYETRGSSVQKTISMWDSVRQGEKRWIFPFQENADEMLNSSTLYELAVLKRHIFPLLTAVGPEDECYDEVRSIVKILNYICESDVDDEIPPTSIVREFIGGNSFYK